jgi:RHS repeat-associated protein
VYSDGRHFNYTYDANGNALTFERDLGPGTVTTTYNYDAANQLNSASEGSNTWQFTYDANGSLTSNGVSAYTYDSAHRLVAVDGPTTDSTMTYNGLSQRLSMEASGVTTQYVMDGNNPLIATSNGNATTYLYGLGPIAEKTTVWNYTLPDRSNTPRQLTDASGEVIFAARYTPWGSTLETYGTGNFEFGYFGGMMDEASGLLYIGNGQYYDPATGRFLNRDAKPNNSNPYVPFDPMGALVAPLGLLAMFYSRKKNGSKWGMWIALMLVIGSVGMGLAACNPPAGPITATGTYVPETGIATGTVIFSDGTTISGTLVATPSTPSVTPIPCPTPTTTSTPPPTLTPPPTNPTEGQMIEYIVSFGITLEGNWTGKYLSNLWEALFKHIGYLNLKSWLGGGKATFKIGGEPKCSGDYDCYSGLTQGSIITFLHIGNAVNPVINMLHEIGHLEDNLWQDYFSKELRKVEFTQKRKSHYLAL